LHSVQTTNKCQISNISQTSNTMLASGWGDADALFHKSRDPDGQVTQAER